MPTLRLTDAAAHRLKAQPGERVEYFDRLLPGFGLRVSGPTASRRELHKAWFVFYRVHGRLRRLTINTYPALSLKDAREEAREALRAAKRGDDAAALKRANRERRPDTVEAVVDDFMQRHMQGKRRAESYIAATRGIFDNHVLPRWRGRDIGTITRRDVIELLDAVVDQSTRRKNGRRAGGPIAANRTLAAVSRLFTWALHRDIITATPAARVERPGPEARRERALSGDEIRELWPLLDALGYPFGPFFKVVLLTGQRRDEVAAMRWAEIDEAELVWMLPAERTKAARAHTVPLSPLAAELIADCRRQVLATWKTLGAHVFTVTNDGPITGFSKAKARLDKAIVLARAAARAQAGAEGEPEKLKRWTIHDLRRTAATGLARLGVQRLVISLVLNHIDRSITAVYDRHAYLGEKRHALEAWANYLAKLTAPPGANVVQLRG